MRKLVALALVTASLGFVGSTLAGGSSSTPKPAAPRKHTVTPPLVIPRPIAKLPPIATRRAFTPPPHHRVEASTLESRRLPFTGFDLPAVTSLGLALIALGFAARSLLRQPTAY